MRNIHYYITSFIILFVLNSILSCTWNICYENGNNFIYTTVAIINGAGVSLLLTLAGYIVQIVFHINIIRTLLFFCCGLFAIECFLLINFYSLITPSILLVLLETNPSEAKEFLHTYFSFDFIIYICLVFISCIIIYNIIKRIYNIKYPVFFINKRNLSILSFGIISAYFILFYNYNYRLNFIKYSNYSSVERVIRTCKITYEDKKKYNLYLNLAKDKNVPKILENGSDIPYIVIILGESASKYHMNAYGYYLPNTPYLNQRLEKQSAILYDSVYTPKTATVFALREILTFYNQESTKEWYEYHTIPSIFKAAGYTTFWLSNQDSFNRGDDNSTASIISTSDIVKFVSTRHGTEERPNEYDELLLPIIDEELKKVQNNKNLFIIHLMGSHQQYTNRYPISYNVFNENDIKGNHSTKQKEIIANYDNSILYNDYIINEIINRFEDKDAIVVYFSDHGEEVYDTRDMAGHSNNNPTYTMINVPFIIWTSNEFKEKRPDLIKRFFNTSTQNKPHNTTNFIHTLLDISNIKTTDYIEKGSLFY